MKLGDAISIAHGDDTSPAYYRTHCVESVSERTVSTWCGLVLPRISVGPERGEDVCSDCMNAVLEVECEEAQTA